jgi:hypothetical protein
MSNNEDDDPAFVSDEATFEEGILFAGVTVLLCSCIHMFSWWTGEPFLDYHNSVGFLVLFYLGWCLYAVWWGVRWRRQHKR